MGKKREIPRRRRSLDRGQGQGLGDLRRHARVGLVGGRFWSPKGNQKGSSEATAARISGVSGQYRRGPWYRSRPQRIRPVVFSGGSANGDLVPQRPRAPAVGATLPDGGDVQADR